MGLSESEYLAEVNAMLKRNLNLGLNKEREAEEATLNAIAAHLCLSASAKRARPLLCLYFYQLFEAQWPEKLVKIGLAAELIHAASLLHDDVVDAAQKRRGKSSANQIYGNPQAVLAGNYLLTKAFDLLRDLPRPLIDKAIEVVREMTIAALREIHNRKDAKSSKNDWMKTAVGKTGLLFSWCGFSVAHLFERSEEADHLWQIGERLGIIFQMADDIKDFSGDNALKDHCKDIENQDPSLPIIIACQKSERACLAFSRAFAQEKIGISQKEELKNIVLSSGALEDVSQMLTGEISELLLMLTRFEASLGYRRLSQWIDELQKAYLPENFVLA